MTNDNEIDYHTVIVFFTSTEHTAACLQYVVSYSLVAVEEGSYMCLMLKCGFKTQWPTSSWK